MKVNDDIGDGDSTDIDSEYYRSQFLNRLPNNLDESNTGLAVLVHLSRQDQEMNRESGKSHVIRWLYRESEEMDDDKMKTSYYIELNQRRVYVDIHLESTRDRFVSVKCRDGGPTFYKTESIQKLHDRLYNGIIPENTPTSKAFESLKMLQNRYERYNQLTLPIPTIQKAFMSRISTPLSIMQFMGKILSILEDDSLLPSIMSFGSTLGQHYWNSMRSIVSAKELATEIKGNVQDNVECMYWTLRPKQSKLKKRHKKQWELLPSSKILPGDIFCFPPQRDRKKTIRKKEMGKKTSPMKKGDAMPVDALLLEGHCLALEAVITGESVPQAKIALDVDQPEDRLSIDTSHRSSALFAGTTIIQCANDSIEETENIKRSRRRVPKLPHKYTKSMPSSIQPVKCLSLKTGSYSSKGEIIRALSKGKNRSGSVSNAQMDRDSIKLISVLATFAVGACATLFIPALQTETTALRHTSAFRRAVQCSRIAVASVPSNLPLALSYVAHTCSTKLRQDADVVCSEPGALLTASCVNMVVFDKTGTLTSDTQSLKKIVPMSTETVHYMTEVVLAGCHSLVTMDNNSSSTSKLVGDPLDAASLEFSKWLFNGINKTASPTAKLTSSDKGIEHLKRLWQIKTFPFDPTRRRSASLVILEHGDNYRLWILMKGSADAMTEYIKFKDESDEACNKSNYLNTVEDLGSKGFRVISMAVKDVSDNEDFVKKLFPNGITLDVLRSEETIDLTIARARNLAQSSISINDIENTKTGHFDHVGFSCFDTFLRPSTSRVIRDLRQSGTGVCMLTGDAPDAALSVARQAAFFEKSASKKSYLLDINEKEEVVWIKKNNIGKKRKTKVRFCVRSTESILQKASLDKCIIAASGRAIDHIFDILSDNSKANDLKVAALYFMRNLSKVKVISRSSPATKQRVIGCLKKHCNMNVMMCGDGVNDIAAMKTADISAALLTGYGSEESSKPNFDFENERRVTKLNEKPIGKNRLTAYNNRMRSRQHRTWQEIIALKKGGTGTNTSLSLVLRSLP